MTLRRAVKLTLITLVLCGLAFPLFAYVIVTNQGVPDGFWRSFELAKVRFDERHIPTLEASDWTALIGAQGYVVASERLWQMDLVRRKAGGRLAEWFGEKAFDHDQKMRTEGRGEAAVRAAKLLPSDERSACDAYADGVNRFIAEHRHRWGIEYLLLRADAEPWTCADSLLVILEMADVLSSYAHTDAQQAVWKKYLAAAWQEFLFPQDHPWNQPMFGSAKEIALPPKADYLPASPLTQDQKAAGRVTELPAYGSNSWVWRGPSGAFLANDPHLGNAVPSIWFAMRLKLARDEWVVGTAIPGIPGIVIGMNPHLAWSFTNTGEDVDDYLEERLNADRTQYLSHVEGEREVWRPVVEKTYEVKVRGEARPRLVTGRATHRGPLAQRSHLGPGYFARQWLPLKEATLRLPALAFNRARSPEELMAAVDAMRAPAQNILFLDKAESFGYRVSGTGVKRRTTGLVPQRAIDGEWLALEPPDERRRLIVAPSSDGEPQFLATANERIWADEFGHQWSMEDRKQRIVQVLAASPQATRQTMEELHVDVTSRYRRELLSWLSPHLDREDQALRARAERWQRWDGTSRSDPLAFAEAGLVERELVALLVGRVQRHFFSAKAAADLEVPYNHPLRRAWAVRFMAAGEQGAEMFGTNLTALGRYLGGRLGEIDDEEGILPHHKANRWQGQHPFVDKLPVLGRLFAIGRPNQWGASDTVCAEQPRFGPSMRLVWDMRHPWESSWSFPIGQSGHIGSPHYRDLQENWFEGVPFAVFADTEGWEFPGRAAPSVKKSGT